jgi:hypothetical protein
MLSDRAHALILKRYRNKMALTTGAVFVAFWVLLGSLSTLQNESLIAKLQTVRPLEIYIHNDPKYPHIDPQTQLESIAVAIQSFQEHFGIDIKRITIRKDELPAVIQEHFPELWTNPQRSSLSYWESRVFPRLSPRWEDVASTELPILLTNIPIVNDLSQETTLETAHLNPWGLVSGLGHPSLTIVSTYRMLREEDTLFGKATTHEARRRLQARFIGEYVFAHELGHALLGLSDFVLRGPRQPSQVALRGPASIHTDEPDYARCLMHSDSGGGYRAWHAIRESRNEGRDPASISSESCPEYRPVLTAFHLRAQALAAIRRGEREEAAKLYEEILDIYTPQNKNWLRNQWEQESLLFVSFIRRWWAGLFVIQSKQ